MVKNREKYTLSIFGISNLILCTLLTIFVLDTNVPVLFNLNEQIAVMGSKWIMLLAGIIPCIFVIFAYVLKSKPVRLLFKFLFAVSIFETMIWFIYFGLSEQLYVGATSEISFAIAFFFPASFAFMAYGLNLKNPEYKSKTGINFKNVETTEFIWIQSHLFARYIFFFTGFILFLISLVFAFFHMSYILIPIFVIAIVVCYIIVWNYAESMKKKYEDMKTRKDNLEKGKEEKIAKKKDFKEPVINRHENPRKKVNEK